MIRIVGRQRGYDNLHMVAQMAVKRDCIARRVWVVGGMEYETVLDRQKRLRKAAEARAEALEAALRELVEVVGDFYFTTQCNDRGQACAELADGLPQPDYDLTAALTRIQAVIKEES